jgi:CubicO group peptidase (beta-lactamase class C family)
MIKYNPKNFKLLKFLPFIIVIILFNSCQIGRFIFYNFADIKDYKKFPKRTLKASDQKFIFNNALKSKSPKTLTVKNKKDISFDQFLKDHKTVAFMIIQNDSIYYEKYFKGYDETSIVPSFSVAKSVTSILIGCAIDDGFIKSVDEPITNYLPQLKKNGLDKVTIKHLLQMTSGINFNESYVNPFGHAASFYYGQKLRKSVNKLKLKDEPGTKFKYISGNTQVLGMVLEAALKGKTLTSYLQEKIWLPIGMEYDASWSIDRKKEGVEKTFCCLNARARDFAKIGRLYLNKGNWNGNQIVSTNWVNESTKIDSSNGSASYYQYQWWILGKDGDYMAEGILGQFIYVNPSKNLIMVRLGKNTGNVQWWRLFQTISAMY